MLEVRRLIDTGTLSGEHYFRSLAQAGLQTGLLDSETLARVEQECTLLLSRLTSGYLLHESSSIRVEDALDVLESALFTVGLALKRHTAAEEALRALIETPFDTLYRAGRKLLNAKVNHARHLYLRARQTRVDTPLIAYNGTLSHDGLGTFFARYDRDYHAHDIPANIDYPLFIEVRDRVGAEYMQAYCSALCLENEFLAHFSPEALHALLLGHDRRYRHLLINLFGEAFFCALLLAALHKPVQALRITHAELTALESRLIKMNEAELRAFLLWACERLEKELSLADTPLAGYMRSGLLQIADRVAAALHTVFYTKCDPVNTLLTKGG